jgi:hypothetical protein
VDRYDYTLTIRPAVSRERRVEPANPFEGVPLAIDGDRYKRITERANPLPEPELKLVQGEKTVPFQCEPFTGSSSTPDGEQSVDAPRRAFSLDRDALIQARLEVDASFRPQEKGEYLNKVEAELGGYLAGEWQLSLLRSESLQTPG